MSLTTTIRIISKAIGAAPQIELIEPSLDAMQARVGGDIQFVPLLVDSEVPDDDNLKLVLNENGKVERLQRHLTWRPEDTIVGHVFVARFDEDADFVSLTDADIPRVIAILNERDLTR